MRQRDILKLRLEDSYLNFSNALDRFSQVIDQKQQYLDDGYGDVFLDIAVKRFEFTFEMAWKLCKRALDYQGFNCKSPRECLKEAYTQHLLDEEQVWLDMLEQRNLSAHIYEEYSINEIQSDLIRFHQAFSSLKEKLAADSGLHS